ncbi:MAG TPA: hypothetical protein ENK73_02685 [Thiomicrospira sp.]|nr:hypothetical protein [Thiomicrospira sp.]
MPISPAKVAFITLFTGLAGFAQASDDMTTKISTGLFYSSGQSDTIDTDDATTNSIPFMVSIKKGDVSFGLSTAYISVDSNSFDASGLGDTTVSIGYDLTEKPWLTVKLKNKFATGDEAKGLSTGENDTSVQLDYFYPVKSNTSLFANIGHKFVGKVSGVAMQDTNYGSIGGGYIFPSKTNIGVSLDYRQSIFKNLDDQMGASVFLSRPITKTYSLSGFGSYDNTQTLSTGLTVTAKF